MKFVRSGLSTYCIYSWLKSAVHLHLRRRHERVEYKSYLLSGDHFVRSGFEVKRGGRRTGARETGSAYLPLLSLGSVGGPRDPFPLNTRPASH